MKASPAWDKGILTNDTKTKLVTLARNHKTTELQWALYRALTRTESCAIKPVPAQFSGTVNDAKNSNDIISDDSTCR